MSDKHRTRERAYIALIAKQDALLRECAEAAETLRSTCNTIFDKHLDHRYPFNDRDGSPMTWTLKAEHVARVLRACRDAGRAD